jgi:zinc finger BED domain-containing protein 5/7/8/9
MDKFIIRGEKRSGSASASGSSPPTKKNVTRQYDDSYLAFGFVCERNQHGEPLPQCLLCRKVLSNANMAPSKLKRHLETTHQLQCMKPLEYFQRLAKDRRQEGKKMLESATLPEQALEASFLVSLRIAKAKKPHTLGEDLILPAAVDMCRVVIGDHEATRLKGIPLSNDTVSRRIHTMAEDIEIQLFERLKQSEYYALQTDESLDIANRANLLVYVRYIWEGSIEEDMLFCKSLPDHATGTAMFAAIDETISCNRGGWSLGWEKCVGVCTDGAAAMVGVREGVVSRIKEKSPNVLITHCIIHRENLAAKQMNASLNAVFQAAVKIVNFIKSRPLHSRLFANLCAELGAEHKQLLLHTEVRWLSRGKVLTRLYELREEVKVFLVQHDGDKRFEQYILSNDWIVRLAYLSDIYEKMNALNASLQGPETNIIHSSAKIDAFIRKLNLWHNAIAAGNPDFFDRLADSLLSSGLPIECVKEDICEHISALQSGFSRYFKLEKGEENFPWIADPFSCNPPSSLAPQLQEMLIDLSSDQTLKTEYQNVSLSHFWMKRQGDYPPLFKEAVRVLLPFASTYLCEGE